MIEFPFVETHGNASPSEERTFNSLKIKNKKMITLSLLGDALHASLVSCMGKMENVENGGGKCVENVRKMGT